MGLKPDVPSAGPGSVPQPVQPRTRTCARALELVCIMYAEFERIEPGMDIGVDLGEEYGMAEKMMAEECKE